MNNEQEDINRDPGFSQDLGYTTPKNYFEDLDADIFLKISEGNLSKQLDFKVPQAYFKNIDEKIYNAVKPAQKRRLITFPKRIIRYAAAAACLVVFYGINQWGSDQNSYENILASDVELWLEDSFDFSINSELAFTFENEFDFSENDIVFNEDLIEEYFNDESDIDLLNEIEQ